MNLITKKVYEQIQKDMPVIEQHIEYPMLMLGSEDLWNKLKLRYSIIFPEMMSQIKENLETMTYVDRYNNSPELEQLKEGLLTYLLLSNVEEDLNESVKNHSSDLLNQRDEVQEDTKINEIIEESKLYIRSSDPSKKQIALEKIWDAFERLKTVYSDEGNKKKRIEKLINDVSHKSEANKKMINDEFLELTRIGNDYQIRHFEKEKHEIPSDKFKEYLYFRVLSLISYCIQESKI